MDKLIPLCDDLDEWAARSWWRALLVALFPNSCLAIRLRTQLKARPKTWGIGLWADKEKMLRMPAQNVSTMPFRAVR